MNSYLDSYNFLGTHILKIYVDKVLIFCGTGIVSTRATVPASSASCSGRMQIPGGVWTWSSRWLTESSSTGRAASNASTSTWCWPTPPTGPTSPSTSALDSARRPRRTALPDPFSSAAAIRAIWSVDRCSLAASMARSRALVDLCHCGCCRTARAKRMPSASVSIDSISAASYFKSVHPICLH